MSPKIQDNSKGEFPPEGTLCEYVSHNEVTYFLTSFEGCSYVLVSIHLQSIAERDLLFKHVPH